MVCDEMDSVMSVMASNNSHAVTKSRPSVFCRPTSSECLSQKIQIFAADCASVASVFSQSNWPSMFAVIDQKKSHDNACGGYDCPFQESQINVISNGRTH